MPETQYNNLAPTEINLKRLLDELVSSGELRRFPSDREQQIIAKLLFSINETQSGNKTSTDASLASQLARIVVNEADIASLEADKLNKYGDVDDATLTANYPVVDADHDKVIPVDCSGGAVDITLNDSVTVGTSVGS